MRNDHCFKPVGYKTPHRAGRPDEMQWFAFCTALEYYDTFETLVIRDIHELWPGGHNAP